MPEPLPGYQTDWQEALEYAWWGKAYGYTPNQVDELPLSFYDYGLQISSYIEVLKNGGELVSAEPGWVDISLNNRSG
jgi:hypothetical protein